MLCSFVKYRYILWAEGEHHTAAALLASRAEEEDRLRRVPIVRNYAAAMRLRKLNFTLERPIRWMLCVGEHDETSLPYHKPWQSEARPGAKSSEAFAQIYESTSVSGIHRSLALSCHQSQLQCEPWEPFRGYRLHQRGGFENKSTTWVIGSSPCCHPSHPSTNYLQVGVQVRCSATGLPLDCGSCLMSTRSCISYITDPERPVLFLFTLLFC